MSVLLCIGLGIGFLAIGYNVYRLRWPDGLWPPEEEDDLERIRRIGRRRVLPLPPAVPGRERHQGGRR